MKLTCKECGEDGAFEWHLGVTRSAVFDRSYPVAFIGCLVCSATVATYDEAAITRFLTEFAPAHEGLPQPPGPACLRDREIDDIIRHSLGLGDADKPYRRHYCSPPTPALTEAVERGLMTGPHERDDMVSPMWFVTKTGASSVGATLPT